MGVLPVPSVGLPTVPRFAGRAPAVAAEEKDWTLLFYNAGYADEAKMCTATLADLERVGSNADTHVVAFNHRTRWSPERLLGAYAEFDGARSYYVTQAPAGPRLTDRLPDDLGSLADFALSGPRDLKSPELGRSDANPGEAETLKRFLVDTMKRYPSKRVALVLSGHGSAFGGQAIMHRPEGRIKNEELARVLREAEAETGRKLDLLNLNTCYGANLETLYPLRDAARAVVASEGGVFAATQPFGRVLQTLQEGLATGRDVTGPELAKVCVEEARRQPMGNLYTGTLTAVDAAGVEAVARAQSHLQEVLRDREVDPALVRGALKDAKRFLYSSVPQPVYLTDVASFASLLEERVADPQVQAAARAVQDRLSSCILAEHHEDPARESLGTKGLRFLLGRELPDLSGLGGLTVYLDENPAGPNNRVEQVGKTEYGSAVDVAGVHDYLSLGRPQPGLLSRLKVRHDETVAKVAKRLPFPAAAPLLERVALGGAMLGTFSALSAAGIPAYPLIFGTMFTARGALGAVQGTLDAARLATAGPLTARQKETLVDHAGKAALGVAMGSFGLYLLGALPREVAWPAAIAAVGIRAGKELVKLWATRGDRAAVAEADRSFRADPFRDFSGLAGKLAPKTT